jgi:hypothetical protein
MAKSTHTTVTEKVLLQSARSACMSSIGRHASRRFIAAWHAVDYINAQGKAWFANTANGRSMFDRRAPDEADPSVAVAVMILIGLEITELFLSTILGCVGCTRSQSIATIIILWKTDY